MVVIKKFDRLVLAVTWDLSIRVKSVTLSIR